MDNLGEFSLLRGGTYVGSKNAGIELQMLPTKEDGKMTKQIHRVTKMCDTILVSFLKQPNMFEREVIGICIF